MRGVCLGAEKQLSNSKMCGIHMITQAGYGKKVYDSIYVLINCLDRNYDLVTWFYHMTESTS